MDLSALPITHQATVPEDYLDVMGHMNVMWYIHLFDEGTWAFFAAFGMNRDYYDAYQAGAFAIKQHTRYLAEVRGGAHITVRTRALGRSAKRFHFMHFMTVDESGALAATTELLGAHMDMTVRRTSPVPDSIAAAFDRLLAEHSQLDWDAPVCGVIQP